MLDKIRHRRDGIGLFLCSSAPEQHYFDTVLWDHMGILSVLGRNNVKVREQLKSRSSALRWASEDGIQGKGSWSRKGRCG